MLLNIVMKKILVAVWENIMQHNINRFGLIKCFLCLVICSLCEVGFSQQLEAISSNISLYISPSGSDSEGDGTLNNPWATPHRAISYLNDYWISPSKIVKIIAQAGIYNLSTKGPIVINHPCGTNISIEGDGGEVVFSWGTASSDNGVVVEKGSDLGNLNGIRLTGDGENGIGILADGFSMVYCGSNVEVDNFYDGIVVQNNSFANTLYLYSHDNANCGIRVSHRGQILSNYASFEGNRIGIQVDHAGYAYTHYSSANNNEYVGFFYDNSGKSFSAVISAIRNGKCGIEMRRDSFINADNSTSIYSGLANYSPLASKTSIPNYGNFGSWIFADACVALQSDLSGDCTVDLIDLGILSNEWLLEDTNIVFQSDMNGDGKINMADFIILANEWALNN
jgi:hypothetical protein